MTIGFEMASAWGLTRTIPHLEANARGDMHSFQLLLGRGFGGNSLIYIITTTAIGSGGGGGCVSSF